MRTVEWRHSSGLVELRGGDKPKIGGYAAKFGKLSRNLGGFVEVIMPVAFNRARGREFSDVIATFNHDKNMMLGSIDGGTLRMHIDETGLFYEVSPPTARADIVELVARGDVRHSSFGFRGFEDEWERTDQGYPLRKFNALELVEVAPVIDPAYPDATAGLRSLAAHFEMALEEVQPLAAADDLRSLFVKTGPEAARQKFGAAAKMELLAKREPAA